MKLILSRQWVACITIVAVLFSSAAPLGFCRCVGCHCENSISRLLPDLAVADRKCCCIPPELLPAEECCGLPKIPCPCLCCNIQKSDTVIPAILPAKQPIVNPSWNTVSRLPVDFANGSAHALGLSPSIGNYQVLSPPHVPLHVLLCIFRN